MLQSNTPINDEWDGRNEPWHWALIKVMYKHCQGVLEDPTLRDLDGHPPPKDIWFESKQLEAWRRDRERERDIKAKRESRV